MSIIRLAECCPHLHSIYMSFCDDTDTIRFLERSEKGCANLSRKTLSRICEDEILLTLVYLDYQRNLSIYRA